MKKLIYSQEDLDLILSLETETKDEEIERLNNIIKEVREKIGSIQILGLRSGKTFISTLLNDILEILDKAGVDKE